MVDTTERHQVRCQSAVRNAALHKSDLNAGIRIVQKPEVFLRTISQAQPHLNPSVCQDAFIAGAKDMVMLTFRRGRDCDLRRRRGNEIRDPKPSEAGDTQYRRHYFEHMPTSDAQHVRFRSAHRLTKNVVRKLNPTTEDQATLAAVTGATALARMSAFGPKRTCRFALHMSAFRGKADIRKRSCLLSRSL